MFAGGAPDIDEKPFQLLALALTPAR